MRKTKIICTIGPSSENEETLTQMCLAGMNVARLNFSHGTHEEHARKIELIKQVRQKLGLPIAIMLDTKGPEYRIRTFAAGKVTIADGSTFTFTTDEVEGDETRVSVNYKALHKDLKPGDVVTVNNGMVQFEVEEICGHDIRCKCLVGGMLSNRKSMSFPNKVMSGPYLSEQDKADILFGIEHGVDFIAASFVSSKQDVLDIQKLLDENGGSDIEIIAKIENRSGVDNVTEICSACGGIMIARGDLGVEIPYVEVPAVQKKLTRKCRLLGKRVITAPVFVQQLLDIQYILLCGYKGGRDKVHSVFNTEKNVRLILLAEIGAGHDLIGKRHTLSVAQHTANQTFAANVMTGNLLHLELHHAVVDRNHVTGLQILVQGLIVYADLCFIAYHFIRGKSKGAAFGDCDFPRSKCTNPVFRPLCMQHNGNGQSQLLTNLLNQRNFLGVFLVGTVGKIQPRDVHAGKAHLS